MKEKNPASKEENSGFVRNEKIDPDVYKKLGAHLTTQKGVKGTKFAVWAPHARAVSVITDKTGWNEEAGKMQLGRKGIWRVFLPGITEGDVYRFVVTGADGEKRFKSDPYAFYTERRPANASIVTSLKGYRWNDGDYMEHRDGRHAPEKPMAIYEVHLGSWKKDYTKDRDGFLNYRELANELSQYVSYMGYTHVELIGICEYPFDGSWGYQVTGFFSPTSRYGKPDDFRYFVDIMHQHGVGVILDWVPAHFPKDDFGLARFDGTPLYESPDPLKAEYPEWGTYAFDHEKIEVQSFLVSSAFYWINEFHIDALRVDAVAAMLYSSFSRAKWRPNKYGGHENLESTEFLRQVNYIVRSETDAYLIAEDSSIIPGITADVDEGGIGFMFKWNMGWMNDTLEYMKMDPYYRKFRHGSLVHAADYAFFERYILVLSHDEVVHLKDSMLEKFPGGLEDKLGSLKSLYAFQFTFPGKKLLFMGQDIAEDREWDENREINWSFAEDFGHRDVMHCVKNLLSIYRRYSCLYSDTKDHHTFEWVSKNDADRNIISYIRRNPWNYDSALLVICNFSPVAYGSYLCGVPEKGYYKRVFSTYDSLPGGGSPGEIGDIPPIDSIRKDCDNHPYALPYGLRPFEAVVFEFPHISAEEKKKAAESKTPAPKAE
jgi:1,4-alpha-glucan branching enzyme